LTPSPATCEHGLSSKDADGSLALTLEVRVLTADEVEQAETVFAHAFGIASRHDTAARMEQVLERSDPDWYLGAFEGEELTSMMCIVPNEMYINGAAIGFGTVSPVASSPLHRRKGHTGAMLRRSLTIMRERGQPLSGLYTPHPSFYRRYGWEIAAEQRTYRFKPKDLTLQFPPTQRGSFRALRPDGWEQLHEVYARYAARNNGPFARNQRWWTTYVVGAPWRGIHDIVAWSDDAGDTQGYAVYLLPNTGDDANKVVVIELVALTGDAYANLLAFFARYDLHNEIVIHGSPHDTLPLQFLDTERLEMKDQFSVMLRVNDFEGAMSARPPARPDETCEVVLRIEDGTAAWNQGTWRIGVADGRTLVERTEAEPELTVNERVLASLFNGYLRPSAGFEAGLVSAADEGAIERADRVFAVKRPPFFPDHF
jgi:predicted acetyltransferase